MFCASIDVVTVSLGAEANKGVISSAVEIDARRRDLMDAVILNLEQSGEDAHLHAGWKQEEKIN